MAEVAGELVEPVTCDNIAVLLQCYSKANNINANNNINIKVKGLPATRALRAARVAYDLPLVTLLGAVA